MAFGQVACGILLLGAVDGPERTFSPDPGDGTYLNPVLAGDYSDPDVLRVGDDYYLVSSSLVNVPGLPILHSRDLVNWSLIGHALPRLEPAGHYATPRRGGGVWAPAIVHHRGLFRIYYPDPDRGIFVVTARDPRGPWSAPVLVDDTRGAIDPAPFFDDDGTAWLAHAYAASRAGISNVIVLKRMNREGTRTLDAGQRIIDGDRLPQVRTSIGMRPWQTTEGPKLYKRNGFYWIFAPSGSVKGGWQGVFRAKRLTGPWEGRNVLDQGPTQINGPHQGAWVRTEAGEDWFLHFHDTDSYGRRVFLEPMRWRDGWPVIGEDPDGDGIGQPVLRHRKPRLASVAPTSPEGDDDFATGSPSLAWQWNANPQEDWVLPASAGWLRLKSASTPANLWEAGNLLSRKLPALRFTATVKLRFAPVRDGERAGLALLGSDYAWVGAERIEGKMRLVQVTRTGANAATGDEAIAEGPPITASTDLWLRITAQPVTVSNPPPDFSPYWPSMLRSTHARATFAYSFDGRSFVPLGQPFESRPGRWVGAQLGIFAQAPSGTPAFAATSVGHADVDWFRLTP
ncbi:glycoside hydrolase 43 family protein [Sphingomonas floccifaciens]|uniref:Glycoside hydrolase 43 family protein n=1 Tax=Sphingomonas floccifaciens TaxID=1844115 RepID=A0ABW4NBK1_9SPHN